MLRTGILLLFLVCSFDIRAQINIDSLVSVVNRGKKDSAHVRALTLLCEHLRSKDKERAMGYMRQIVRLHDVNPGGALSAYVAMALRHAEMSSNDSARFFFEQAQRIADAYPGRKDLLSIIYNGTGVFYKKQGNSEKSLESYFKIEKLGELAVGKENYAGNFLNIANSYNRMGDRKQGIQYLYKALRAFEAIPNERGISYCYNSLGSLLKQQGQLRDAEFYLKKSLLMKEKDGDMKGIANTCSELALVYVDLKDYNPALKYADRTIEISEKLGLQEMLATGLVHKGKVLRLQGQASEALAVLARARPIAKSLENQYVFSQLQLETGKAYSEIKQGEDALATLLSSVEVAGRTRNLEALSAAHRFLAEEYARQEKHKEALQHFERYHQVEDSIRGSQLKLDYKRLETQYQVEKKNAEIELLRKDQELQAKTVQRQRAIQLVIGVALLSVIIIAGLLINRYRVVNRSKRLLEIERVRNTIARDLHDDIGSTLSSINIVSRLGQRSYEAVDSEERFRKIADHSSALMERMSDIVWSINPANDSLNMVVSRMKEFSAEILEPTNIQYSFTGTETLNGETLDVDMRRNIFLVFKEAVNNAAKYSQSTKVDIEIRQQNESLFLAVRDNGKGFDLASARRGNGLKNMEERARAMGAMFSIESEQGKGTTVSITVPLA
jgi:two-component system, NarL family, sensor histidine kinase UhpB